MAAPAAVANRSPKAMTRSRKETCTYICWERRCVPSERSLQDRLHTLPGHAVGDAEVCIGGSARTCASDRCGSIVRRRESLHAHFWMAASTDERCHVATAPFSKKEEDGVEARRVATCCASSAETPTTFGAIAVRRSADRLFFGACRRCTPTVVTGSEVGHRPTSPARPSRAFGPLQVPLTHSDVS